MALIERTTSLLPPGALTELRERVAAATSPQKMGTLGRSPYTLTFWYALESTAQNLVEVMIRERLRPCLTDEESRGVIGVEWWLGRLEYPYADNFSFGLHRDFGEHPTTGAFESPHLSSVLYLTTIDDGPLVVFGADPELRKGAFDFCLPQANTFVRFPGHLWHAILKREDVLDAPPPIPPTELRLSITVNWWRYRPAKHASPPMELIAADWDGSVYPELR